ncbi:uncharacterized protein J4E84_006792 [Alternaria hordeiaustralica]|uniref:uncharacterized protein n=1 Tax=Alternaria hordeiaustralica TaxID=1187925 RepID=UPI0020C361C9|nr:uncharacterized protein J4E84_006792 [Alternaria hordeiaustralica]KAI4683952.1 hypothetical protein J4E84_006792 [Alternaria hordeiaustralica]
MGAFTSTPNGSRWRHRAEPDDLSFELFAKHIELLNKAYRHPSHPDERLKFEKFMEVDLEWLEKFMADRGLNPGDAYYITRVLRAMVFAKDTNPNMIARLEPTGAILERTCQDQDGDADALLAVYHGEGKYVRPVPKPDSPNIVLPPIDAICAQEIICDRGTRCSYKHNGEEQYHMEIPQRGAGKHTHHRDVVADAIQALRAWDPEFYRRGNKALKGLCMQGGAPCRALLDDDVPVGTGKAASQRRRRQRAKQKTSEQGVGQ